MWTSWILLFTAILALLIYLRYKAISTYWKNRNVHCLKPLDIIKNDFGIFTANLSLGRLFNNIYNYSGAPFEGFFIFNKPWLMIRDAHVIKSVLITDFDNFCNRATAYSEADKIGTGLLFFVPNPQSKYARTKLIPIFNSSKLKQFYTCIDKGGDKFVSCLSEEVAKYGSANINNFSSDFTSNMMSLFAFGMETENIKGGYEMVDVINNFYKGSIFRKINIVCWMTAPHVANLFGMKFVSSTAAETFRRIFWQNYKQLESNPIMGGLMMQHLMKLRSGTQDPGFVFDGDNLVAQSVLCYAAGVDTMSVSISYALYELGQNPDIQERLRKEILEVSTEWNNSTYEKLNEIQYLEMVLKETLRKHPPFPYLDRICNEDYHVPGSDVTIPKGTRICMSIQGVHHDPTIYKNPEIFDPERFSKEQFGSRPTGCYLPFSMGQRVCIGERLAVLIIKAAIAKIVSQFKVHPGKDTSMEFASNTLVVTPLNDIQLILSKI